MGTSRLLPGTWPFSHHARSPPMTQLLLRARFSEEQTEAQRVGRLAPASLGPRLSWKTRPRAYPPSSGPPACVEPQTAHPPRRLRDPELLCPSLRHTVERGQGAGGLLSTLPDLLFDLGQATSPLWAVSTPVRCGSVSDAPVCLEDPAGSCLSLAQHIVGTPRRLEPSSQGFPVRDDYLHGIHAVKINMNSSGPGLRGSQGEAQSPAPVCSEQEQKFPCEVAPTPASPLEPAGMGVGAGARPAAR